MTQVTAEDVAYLDQVKHFGNRGIKVAEATSDIYAY